MTSSLMSKVSNPEAITNDPFAILKDLTSAVNQSTVERFEDREVQMMVLYALENRSCFGEYAVILDSLLRARGLYPYLDTESLYGKELLSHEAHRPIGLEEIVLHQEQAEVYLRLMAGENVVLSAPTSFGKSLVVDAVVASGKYQNIAVVVPTIALIDEIRRRLSLRFGQTYKVITHASQALEARNIYVMTQERILDFTEMPQLDFFVIDEFYKLDPRRDADRSFLLNQAFYRLLKTNAQFYMLGPNIERVPDSFSTSLRSTFISTPYATVVTEQIRIESSKHDALEKLISLCKELDDSTLIYCASPASARRVAAALVSSRLMERSDEVASATEWVADNYHPDWIVAKAMSYGVGVHHGKIPRALSQYAVRSFNEGKLRFLVCTSTLIEGVNTKAKNVVIYDNRVATKKFDFFTFNNIRGRSGRMFQHFVGKVYLFNAPPQDDLPFVDVPLINQSPTTPDSLLVQLEDIDLTDESRARMVELKKNSDLSLELIRSNSGIDPSAQLRLAAEIRSNGSKYFPLLRWTGFPDYDQLEAVCTLIWNFFVQSSRMGGVYSAKQLSFRIDRLRKARSVRKLILNELAQQDSPDADAAVEDVLDFVRTWASFHFPRYLMALDRIQREIFEPWTGVAGNYSAYAASVENLFSSSGLVALDEYGIPLQVAEKISANLGDHSTVDGAIAGLRGIREVHLDKLSVFERELVISAQKSLGQASRTPSKPQGDLPDVTKRDGGSQA